MAIPRIFVSSTCYDLKYVRENLRYFMRTLGYDPILSEDGTVFFNPALHTHDACLAEVPNCQLFVLIIGGRFGGRYHGGEQSITNAEYQEAVRLRIPIFALVDAAVHSDHHVYLKNRNNADIDLTKLVFPSVDSLKVFEFIDEVRSNVVNNALVPFRDFGDIESYLRQQWAGMMFEFLVRKNESARIADMLAAIGSVNSRVEMLSKQILASVGTADAKIDAALYEEMIADEPIRDLGYWGKRPTPLHVLMNGSFRSCAKALGVPLRIDEDKGMSIGTRGYISRAKFAADSSIYKELRARLIGLLKKFGLTPEEYARDRGRSDPLFVPPERHAATSAQPQTNGLEPPEVSSRGDATDERPSDDSIPSTS